MYKRIQIYKNRSEKNKKNSHTDLFVANATHLCFGAPNIVDPKSAWLFFAKKFTSEKSVL